MSLFELKYRVTRRIEQAQISVAWKMPRWLVMWCSVRLIANATQGEYGNTIVPELTAMDALKRWADRP